MKAASLLARLLAAAALTVSAVAVATPAVAATPVDAAQLSLTAPAGTVELWIDVADPALAGGDLTVVVSDAAGDAPVAARTTTFGATAIVPAASGPVSVAFASAIAAEPDLSIAAVDGDGVVLARSGARVALAAFVPAAPGELPGQATPVSSSATSPQTGILGLTGTQLLPFIVLIAALLAAGVGLFLTARHRRLHADAALENGAAR